MHRALLHIELIFSLLLIFDCSVNASSTYPIDAGVLDLSKYNYHSNDPIKLNGQWFFTWKKFSGSFDSLSNQSLIDVPGNWSKFTGKSFLNKQTGYGTYGLVILFPDTLKIWSLHLPPIHSAYKLYIDGKLYSEVGLVANDSSMTPDVKTQIINFLPSNDSTFVVLQVSNFHFSSGGIWAPITLGNPELIASERESNLLMTSFLIGSLLIMAFYHVALHLLRTRDKGPLCFALICFLIAIRESFGREAIFYSVLPSVDYEFSIKILYTIFPFALIAFTLYFENLYPSYSKWVKCIAIGVCCIFILLVLVTTNTFYGKYLIFISLAFFLQSLYSLILVIKHIKTDVLQNVLVLTGLIILIGAFVNDILFEAGMINTYFMLPFGFFLFVLCQSVILSIRFSKAFYQTEILTSELDKSNFAFQEMSLKKQQAEAMKAVEEMKNRFFSNITHEFRTPLSLIISPIEKLKRGGWDKDIVEKSLVTIHRSAVSLLHLINQLLDLSKLEANKMELSKYRGNPANFIEGIVGSFWLTAQEKNILLECTCEDLPEELIFDSEKFEKITFNLLSNALKFTQPTGSVTVNTKFQNEKMILTVEDNGIGIPTDKLPYIFERFYQVDNSSTRSFGGTGIGLALVKELVELVGGSITVKSEPGIRTIFRIAFPATIPTNELEDNLPTTVLTIQNVAPFATASEPSLSEIQAGPLILLVEDNKELLEYIRSDLSKSYRVLTATHGKEAWRICEVDLPDLVISDVMMPEMNGFDLCQKIKEAETTNHIGVILLTAKGSMESKVLGLSLGANDYLSKPFNQEELELRINNFLRYKNTLKSYYVRELSGLLHLNELENKKQVNPFLSKLYNTIEQFLDNSEFSVNDLASEMAMSARTLNRKLTSMIGLTANEVIRNYRLRKAVELLRTGSNVSEAAYRVGFDSPSYFGQCFKEVYNTTPSEFISN